MDTLSPAEEKFMKALMRKLIDYAKYPDTGKVRDLMRMYQEGLEITAPALRVDILSSAAASVTAGGISSDVFLPFIVAETELGIISTAALELAQNTRTVGNDGLGGVRSVYDIAVSSGGISRLGILTGLSHLGDRRAYPVISGCWGLLKGQELSQFVSARPPYLYAGYVDFVIEAIELGSVSGYSDDAAAFLRSCRRYSARLSHESEFPKVALTTVLEHR